MPIILIIDLKSVVFVAALSPEYKEHRFGKSHCSDPKHCLLF